MLFLLPRPIKVREEELRAEAGGLGELRDVMCRSTVFSHSACLKVRKEELMAEVRGRGRQTRFSFDSVVNC